MSLGDRLREARRERGWTAVELQAKIRCGGGSITKWEKNERAPGSKWASALAQALGVNERWLVTGEGTRDSGSVAPGTPVGPAALEGVLFSFEWPDIPIETVDAIERAARVEAGAEPGRSRSASAWRLRLQQMLRERGSGRAARPRAVR